LNTLTALAIVAGFSALAPLSGTLFPITGASGYAAVAALLRLLHQIGGEQYN